MLHPEEYIRQIISEMVENGYCQMFVPRKLQPVVISSLRKMNYHVYVLNYYDTDTDFVYENCILEILNHSLEEEN